MIQHREPAASRRPAALRSQGFTGLAITLLGIVSALVLLRLVFLVLSIPALVWSGDTIYSLTEPLVFPLTLLPGGSRPIVGAASLADITAAVLVLIVPGFLLSRPRKR